MDRIQPGSSLYRPTVKSQDEPSSPEVQIVEPCHSVRPSNFIDSTGKNPSAENKKTIVPVLGKKRMREEISAGETGADDATALPQIKKMKVQPDLNLEIVERDIAVCAENVEKYYSWLNTKPDDFSDDCLKVVSKDSFIPDTQNPLLVYDGFSVHLRNSDKLSASALSHLNDIVPKVKSPRLCCACPTPALAQAILSMFPNPRKIAIFMPMAGAGLLARMLAEEVKKTGKTVDIFPYDRFPPHTSVKAASVDSQECGQGDSFSIFNVDVLLQESGELARIRSKHSSDPDSYYGYNHFVMLLDFPQFISIEPCPLQIAVDNFMSFGSPKSKQIIYWGIGRAAGNKDDPQVDNPFEKRIEQYNQRATEQWQKKRTLNITHCEKEYPKTFSNEVLQQVSSEIPTPAFKKR